MKAHRSRLGLTQREVAEALLALAWEHDHDRLGVDAGMVSKWERGQKRPCKLYRRLLCQLYNATEEQLGLRPSHAQGDQENGDDLNRRQFLRNVGQFGVAAALTSLDPRTHPRHAHTRRVLDRDTVDGYVTITAAQRTLYWSTPPAPMLESSLAHTHLGMQLLGDDQGGNRARLAASVAESGLLSARVAFFDLGRADLARNGFHVARELAHQAEEQALAAAVYGHMAFVPGFAGDFSTAEATMDVAYAHARHATAPRLLSWLHCVHAELAARNGRPGEADRHIRGAEDALGLIESDPDWMDFFDPARVQAFAGHVQLLSGEEAKAAITLEEALVALHPTATKQRSIVRLDLAAACAPSDPDRSVHLVGEAVEALQSDWYAMARDRIPRVRWALEGTPYRAELEERLRLLPAVAIC